MMMNQNTAVTLTMITGEFNHFILTGGVDTIADEDILVALVKGDAAEIDFIECFDRAVGDLVLNYSK